MLCFITTIKERTLRGKNFYTSPQNGRTPRGIKILVHKVDGPHKGKKTYIGP